MPAYEYECEECQGRFERRQKMSDEAVSSCPSCGGHVKRLISGGAGAIVRGGASQAAPRSACAMGEACCNPQMGCGSMCPCDN